MEENEKKEQYSKMEERELLWPQPETMETVIFYFFEIHLLDGTVIELAERENLPKGKRSFLRMLNEKKEEELLKLQNPYGVVFYIPRRSILFVNRDGFREIDAWRAKMLEFYDDF